MSKIFVVWDPLYEKVISAHKTEKGALTRLDIENEKDNRYEGPSNCYRFEYDEYELEE